MTVILNSLLFCSLYWNLATPKYQTIFFFVDFQTHISLKLPAWFLPMRSPSNFLWKLGFFLKVICCIFDQFFCAPLTENIAVRLRLLLQIFHFYLKITLWITIKTAISGSGKIFEDYFHNSFPKRANFRSRVRWSWWAGFLCWVLRDLMTRRTTDERVRMCIFHALS